MRGPAVPLGAYVLCISAKASLHLRVPKVTHEWQTAWGRGGVCPGQGQHQTAGYSASISVCPQSQVSPAPNPGPSCPLQAEATLGLLFLSQSLVPSFTAHPMPLGDCRTDLPPGSMSPPSLCILGGEDRRGLDPYDPLVPACCLHVADAPQSLWSPSCMGSSRSTAPCPLGI